MGKMQRRKGAQFEREVAARLTAATGVICRRQLIETQQGNCGDIATELPIAVQCKVGAQPPVWQAIKEAEEVGARLDKIPVAILKRNQKKPGAGCEELAVMRLEDFLKILPKVV